MRRLSILLLALVLCITLPLLAQEQEKPGTPPPPPKPLGEEWDWMIGEWEGYAESPMGKSKEYEIVQFTLDRQFLFIQATSEYNGMTYKGGGVTTVDPETGGLVGYWFDNWRGIYMGKGELEDNKSTMTWEGPMGKSTRITEKVSNDEYTLTVKMTGPDGKEMESKAVMKRKQMEEK